MLAERPQSQPPFAKRLDDYLYVLNDRADFAMSIIFFHGPCNDGEDIREMYLRDWVSFCPNSSAAEVLWPTAWLAEDVPGARIFSATYDLSLKVTSRNGRQDYYLIGENLIGSIFLHAQEYEMWSKPMVLVGHSLGGIVIKQLLLKAHHIVGSGSDAFDKGRVKQFLDNIMLIYYYSTPHSGMTLRVKGHSDAPITLTCSPSPIWENARIMNAYLSRLQQEFRQMSSLYKNWRKATIGETSMTKWDLVGIHDVVVPEGSWRGDDCDSYMTADADHFSVCKPTSKISNSYIDLLSQIEACHYQLRITQHVREAVTRVIVSRETSLKKLPSLDLASLVDLKERLKNSPVEIKTQLVDSSGFLHDLVGLLSEEGRDEGWDADGRIRATTAYILYYLAGVMKLRAQIGLYPQALKRLLNLLHMNMGEKSEVLKAALYALHVLARDGPSAAAICRREGALDHLVFLMGSQEDADVRVKAATTLAFATDKFRENENSFLDRFRACEELEGMLLERQIPNLQYCAAHALANVPDYCSKTCLHVETLSILLLGNRSGEENEEEILHRVKIATIFERMIGRMGMRLFAINGALGNMLRVLEVTKDNPVQLQLSIVKSLHYLAETDCYLLRDIAIGTIGAKSRDLLLDLVRERDNPDVKYYASSVYEALLRCKKVDEVNMGWEDGLCYMMAGSSKRMKKKNLRYRKKKNYFIS